MDNLLTLNGTCVRRARPFDLSGHDAAFAALLQARAAEYGVWALPQAGGRWSLLLDGSPDDWTWTFACIDDAARHFLKMAKTIKAMAALLDKHEDLHDTLRAPGGTPEGDYGDLPEEGDDAGGEGVQP